MLEHHSEVLVVKKTQLQALVAAIEQQVLEQEARSPTQSILSATLGSSIVPPPIVSSKFSIPSQQQRFEIKTPSFSLARSPSHSFVPPKTS